MVSAPCLGFGFRKFDSDFTSRVNSDGVGDGDQCRANNTAISIASFSSLIVVCTFCVASEVAADTIKNRLHVGEFHDHNLNLIHARLCQASKGTSTNQQLFRN